MSEKIKLTGITPTVAGDTFTTLLYSNAVGLLIKRAVFYNSAGTIALTFCMVGFLLFDWASRVWLPWQLPEERKTFIQLQKTFLEVTGIFCLAISFALFLPYGNYATINGDIHQANIEKQYEDPIPSGAEAITPTSASKLSVIDSNVLSDSSVEMFGEKISASVLDMSPYSAFIFFLILTFLWNLLMLYVMIDMSYISLLASIRDGNALDSADFKKYGKRLLRDIDRINDFIVKLNEVRSPTVRGAITSVPTSLHPYFMLGLANTFAQLFAIHMTFTNIYVALILISSTLFFNNLPLIEGSSIITYFSLSSFSYIVLWLLLVVSMCICFSTQVLRNNEIDGDRKMMFAMLSIAAILAASIFSNISTLNLAKPYILLFILFLGIPSILFAVSCIIETEEKGSKFAMKISRSIRRVASLFILLYIFVLCLFVEPSVIVLLVISQQIFITVFSAYSSGEAGESKSVE